MWNKACQSVNAGRRSGAGLLAGQKFPGPHLTAAAQGDKAHCSVAMCKWDLLNLGIPAGSRAPQACACRVQPLHASQQSTWSFVTLLFSFHLSAFQRWWLLRFPCRNSSAPSLSLSDFHPFATQTALQEHAQQVDDGPPSAIAECTGRALSTRTTRLVHCPHHPK